MALWQRFQRLTLWNKIAVAGSLASFVGLVVAALAFFPSPDKTSTPTIYQTQRGDGGRVNVQVGHQSGHLTVIQAEDSVQEPNTALQLIEFANVKGHTLEFKLKNSGSDSAFLTGILLSSSQQ